MNLQNLEIREASAEDLPEILALYAQPDMDNGKIISLQEAKAIFQKMLAYPDYRLFVAEIEKEIVGTFELLIMDNLAHSGCPSAVVEDVVVQTGWQGRGIGTQMMRHAMEICRRKGCYKLILSSNVKREPAHRFYGALGFRKHGYSFLVELQA